MTIYAIVKQNSLTCSEKHNFNQRTRVFLLSRKGLYLSTVTIFCDAVKLQSLEKVFEAPKEMAAKEWGTGPAFSHNVIQHQRFPHQELVTCLISYTSSKMLNGTSIEARRIETQFPNNLDHKESPFPQRWPTTKVIS